MEAKITLLPGDGIGPEVVSEARKVLTAVATQTQSHLSLYRTVSRVALPLMRQATLCPKRPWGLV